MSFDLFRSISASLVAAAVLVMPTTVSAQDSLLGAPIFAPAPPIENPIAKFNPPPGQAQPPGGQNIFTPFASPKHSCTLIVRDNGTLRASTDYLELSSKQLGAMQGVVDVVATNASYGIVVDPPMGFTAAPTGGSVDTTFSATYSASGATSMTEVPVSVPMKLKKGSTEVRLDFIATRVGSEFPAGNYESQLTVLCE